LDKLRIAARAIGAGSARVASQGGKSVGLGIDGLRRCWQGGKAGQSQQQQGWPSPRTDFTGGHHKEESVFHGKQAGVKVIPMTPFGKKQAFKWLAILSPTRPTFIIFFTHHVNKNCVILVTFLTD
jgi:hypothetical protein